MSSHFFTLNNASSVESEIKKSRFIGVALFCEDEQSALKQLRQLAVRHPSANHLAFAWRLRTPEGLIVERFFDAGEPSGTAGRPILAHLQGEDLIHTMVAVIRYFGGVKLGTGGLTRAYSNAAKQAIEAAEKLPWVEMARMNLEIDYSSLQMLEYQLKQKKGKIIDQQFSDKVKVVLELPAKQVAGFQQQFG